MAQFNITVETEILKDLFTQSGKDKAFAKLMESILNQVLQAQASEQIGAGYYERNADRQAYRNGTRDRSMKTRIGTLTLSVPRLRNGAFSTELFARYQRSEQALVLSMMEMVIQGVSTRKVSAITEELCGTEFSKSTVSALCAKLDPAVDAFLNRPLEKRYPFVIVDALYTKVREDGCVHSVGLLLATGVNEEGYREILGTHIADTETEDSWSVLFQNLKDRGLKDVRLVVSDAHSGLVNAIKKHFKGTSWQRCQTHFSRNILDKCPKSQQADLKQELRSLYEASNMETARRLLRSILEIFGEKAPKAMEILEEGFEDAMQILFLPLPLRRRLRTSNSIERLNQEIRRRERVIRIFPNRESLQRLVGALLMDTNEGWLTGKRYLSPESIREALTPVEEAQSAGYSKGSEEAA